MSTFERLAVLVVGLLVAVGVYTGARTALSASRPDTSKPSPNPHGLAMAAGVAARKGIDPLRPPGMPEGARIDPETGFMIGLGLEAGPGESVVPWPRLAPANDVRSRAGLPPDVTALDGARVVMAGFLMPLYKLRDIDEFALVGSHYTCCFARPPGLGDQIIVKLAPGAARMQLTVRPLRVRGTLRIRPKHLLESGEGPLISLFEIDAAQADLLE